MSRIGVHRCLTANIQPRYFRHGSKWNHSVPEQDRARRSSDKVRREGDGICQRKSSALSDPDRKSRYTAARSRIFHFTRRSSLSRSSVETSTDRRSIRSYLARCVSGKIRGGIEYFPDVFECTSLILPAGFYGTRRIY